ncbi:MAG: outer membrane beta-barrel domain-containing protein [Pseudomonadales bacterium]
MFFDYHVTEDAFIEANYAQAEVLDTPFRRIGTPIFPRQEEDVKYYSLSVGINVLPGEIFILDKYVLPSAFYVISGLGNTEFVGDDKFTFNIGFGIRLLLTDSISLRAEARDFMFDNDILGKEELKHNFEFRAGVSFFF